MLCNKDMFSFKHVFFDAFGWQAKSGFGCIIWIYIYTYIYIHTWFSYSVPEQSINGWLVVAPCFVGNFLDVDGRCKVAQLLYKRHSMYGVFTYILVDFRKFRKYRYTYHTWMVWVCWFFWHIFFPDGSNKMLRERSLGGSKQKWKKSLVGNIMEDAE